MATQSVKDMTRMPLEEIMKAQVKNRNSILRIPLVPLNNDEVKDKNIFLKLENLQRTGSFKIRTAMNILSNISDDELKDGIYSVSSGNFGRAMAWCCKERGIKCTIIVPSDVSKVKLDALLKLDCHVIKVKPDDWFKIVVEQKYDGLEGVFIHSSEEYDAIVGNGTIGLEIFEDFPEVEAVVLPWGGGGVACGVASALKSLKPDVKIYVSEAVTSTPLTTSLRNGRPSVLENYERTFIDGMGGQFLCEDMWNLSKNLIDGTVVLSLDQVSKSIKLLLERNRIVAEGAGGAPVAAALTGEIKERNIVCVVSGGNIDTDKLMTILDGKIPQVKNIRNLKKSKL